MYFGQFRTWSWKDCHFKACDLPSPFASLVRVSGRDGDWGCISMGGMGSVHERDGESAWEGWKCLRFYVMFILRNTCAISLLLYIFQCISMYLFNVVIFNVCKKIVQFGLRSTMWFLWINWIKLNWIDINWSWSWWKCGYCPADKTDSDVDMRHAI